MVHEIYISNDHKISLKLCSLPEDLEILPHQALPEKIYKIIQNNFLKVKL